MNRNKKTEGENIHILSFRLISIKKNLSFLTWQSPDNSSSYRVEPAGIFHPAGRQS